MCFIGVVVSLVLCSNITVRDSGGNSPIGQAILYGHTDVEDYLRRRGATLGDENLCEACEGGLLEITKKLVETYHINPSGESFPTCTHV